VNDATGSAIGTTLSSLYNCGANCGYVLINDEYPAGADNSDNAHQKGVLGFDGETGFWLVHSVPDFPPPIASGFSYPSSGEIYAQHFLCLTLTTATFDIIAQQLAIDHPYIYDSNVPSSIAATVPNMVNLVNKQASTSVTNNVVNITTLGGLKYDVFAKSRAWDNELYEYLVAPYYNSSMWAETWQNGVGNTGDYCTPTYPYDVVNVKQIQFSDGTSWTINQDHSKWAIAAANNTVCIGDINRQHGQFSRGGGTYCTSNSSLWLAFHSIIASADICSSLGEYGVPTPNGAGSAMSPWILALEALFATAVLLAKL